VKKLYKFAIAAAVIGGVGFYAVPRARAAEFEAQRTSDKEQTRSVLGTVHDNAEGPLSGAVVYIKNTKTLGVKSFITDQDGSFRFHALSPNVDYELYAEFNGQRSGTKTLSSFDSRKEVTMNLKVDTKK
jgi:protocatechuate 3,4-dioxygenase beta subunit